MNRSKTRAGTSRFPTLLITIIALFCSISNVLAIRFFLNKGEKQCFKETIESGNQVLGEYIVAAGRGDMRVDIQVKNDAGVVIYKKENIESGKFDFVASSNPNAGRQQKNGGDHDPYMDDFDDYYDEMWKTPKYEVCLVSPPTDTPDAKPIKRRITLTLLTGAEATDYGSLAKEQHLSELEVALRGMSDEMKNVLLELESTKEREEKLQAINATTSRRVTWYMGTSCVVMLLVGAYQIIYMKNFFRKKKIHGN